MASDLDRGVPDVPPPLDPGIAHAVDASAVRLAQQEEAFAQQLHADLAAMIPDMAPDGRVFCERMVGLLLWLAAGGPSPKEAGDALRWLGATNRIEGFPDARYVDVARALVRAVRNVSGDSSANSEGSAWLGFFQWAEPHLLAGARQAAAEQAAAQHQEAEQQEAEQAAARHEAAMAAAAAAEAIAQDPASGEPAAGEAGIAAVTDLLGDEDGDDDDDGQIMLSMTRNPQRPKT